MNYANFSSEPSIMDSGHSCFKFLDICPAKLHFSTVHLFSTTVSLFWFTGDLYKEDVMQAIVYSVDQAIFIKKITDGFSNCIEDFFSLNIPAKVPCVGSITPTTKFLVQCV